MDSWLSLAQTPSLGSGEFWNAVGAGAIFGLLGLVLLLAGFFAFEVVTRRLDVEEELQKGNLAVAITVGSFLIAIAIIVSTAIH